MCGSKCELGLVTVGTVGIFSTLLNFFNFLLNFSFMHLSDEIRQKIQLPSLYVKNYEAPIIVHQAELRSVLVYLIDCEALNCMYIALHRPSCLQEAFSYGTKPSKFIIIVIIMLNAPATLKTTSSLVKDEKSKSPNSITLRERPQQRLVQPREHQFGYLSDTSSEQSVNETEYFDQSQIGDDELQQELAPSNKARNLNKKRVNSKKSPVRIDIRKSQLIVPQNQRLENEQNALAPQLNIAGDKVKLTLTKEQYKEYNEARRDLQFLFRNTKQVNRTQLYKSFIVSYPVLSLVPFERFLYDCRMGRYFVAKQVSQTGLTPSYLLKKRHRNQTEDYERQLGNVLGSNWQWVSKRARIEMGYSSAILPESSRQFFTDLFSLHDHGANSVERAEAMVVQCCDRLGDTYVQEFLEEDGLILNSNNLNQLKARYKIGGFLRLGKVPIQYTRLLSLVAQEFSRLVAQTAVNELKQIPVYEKSSEFMTAVMENCLFSEELVMGTNFIVLLHTQRCLRSTLLPWQDLFIQQSSNAEEQPPKAIQYFQTQLPTFIATICGQGEDVTDLILRYPSQLLWEGLLEVVRGVHNKTNLLKLVLLLQSGNIDPIEELREYISKLEERPMLYAELLKNDAAKTMGYTGIRRLFESTKGWSLAQIYQGLKQFKTIDKLVAGSHVANQARTVIQGAQSDDLLSKVRVLAETHKCVDEFEILYKVQLAWFQCLGKCYNVIAGQSLYAARAISVLNRVVAIQLDQGNGKTFGNIQIAAYRRRQAQKPVIYVTINNWLQEQALQKLTMLGETKVKVILLTELLEHLTEDSIVIFDEFYHALVRTKLRYTHQKKLNPIFYLDQAYKSYLSSGHHSPQFESFIHEFYGGEAAYQINRSMKYMQGQEQNYNLHLRSSPNYDVACASAIVQIHKLAKLKPVICFGLKWHEGERFGLGPESPVKQVKPTDNIDHVRQLVSMCPRGVIGLPIEGSIGLDLRFLQDAVVVILSEVPPNPEDTRQMVARGSRSFDNQEGFLFYVGEKDMESILEQHQKTAGGYDFKDGVKVIEILQRLPKSVPKNTDLNAILSTMNNEWMVTIEQMKQGQPDKIVRVMDQIHDQIMLERSRSAQASRSKQAGLV